MPPLSCAAAQAQPAPAVGFTSSAEDVPVFFAFALELKRFLFRNDGASLSIPGTGDDGGVGFKPLPLHPAAPPLHLRELDVDTCLVHNAAAAPAAFFGDGTVPVQATLLNSSSFKLPTSANKLVPPPSSWWSPREIALMLMPLPLIRELDVPVPSLFQAAGTPPLTLIFTLTFGTLVLLLVGAGPAGGSFSFFATCCNCATGWGAKTPRASASSSSSVAVPDEPFPVPVPPAPAPLQFEPAKLGLALRVPVPEPEPFQAVSSFASFSTFSLSSLSFSFLANSYCCFSRTLR